MLKNNTYFKVMDKEELTLKLIEAQYALLNSAGRDNAKSLIILVSGIELAGKGEAVKQLREWVDPRYLGVKADPPNLFSEKECFWQPYVRSIPGEGQIQILFGNWYSDLLATVSHVSRPLTDSVYDAYIEQMRAFELDLKNNNCEVIKIWFDLSWKTLQKRLDEIDASQQRWQKLHGLDWRNKKQYDMLQNLRKRFTQDWTIIDCEDGCMRNQLFAQYILHVLKQLPPHKTKLVGSTWQQNVVPEQLLSPAVEKMDKAEYKNQLKDLSAKVARKLRKDNRNILILFEGMDAAGKGGAIKRIVKQLDPREYEIYSIGVPEKYELRRPYLWRFWTRLKGNGTISIFDRTWYGRVLVERIEGYAKPAEWQRAYDEINRFEENLSLNQTLVIKFWLAISLDEQAKRFESREEMPHKRFKITPDDWRNRSHWKEYLDSAADMLELTHTSYAPWNVIATDDKYTARIQVLNTILQRLQADESA